jgi:flagellin-like hook-associated protein FlgL
MAVTGIGSFATDQLNTALILQTQNSLDNLLSETTSGKKSLTYTGIANVAQQALDFGNQISSTGNFLTNNNVVNLRLQAMNQVYTSAQSEMSTFQQDLQNYINNGQQGNAQATETLQQEAFASLKNMQYYLNTQVDGQYIFSGSKTDTPPVSFGFDTLAQFQQAYDGYTIAYPTTANANLSSTTTSPLNTGSISFNSQNGTISAANPGQFSNLPVGSVVSVSGSPFDGQYTVLANDGTNITVSHGFAAEGDPSTNTFTPNVTLSTSQLAPQDANLNLQPQGVYFSPPGVMTSQVAGQFAGLHAGDSFTVAGAANPANDGNYVVASIDPTNTTLSIQRADFTQPASLDPSVNPDAAATISYPTGTSTATLTDAANGINFNADGTITDNVGGALLGAVPTGSYITVANAASTANDGTYFVASNTAGTLAVQRITDTSLTDEAFNPAAQITNGSATTFTPGSLGFDSSSSVITAANPGSLSGITVGQTVNVSGSASNNGNFTVTGVFATPVVDEANNGNAQLVDGTTGFAGATTGGLAFDSASNTITAANGGTLTGVNVGDVISVSGTANNNGKFVVTGVDPTDTQLTVAPANSAVQVASNVSLSTSSYYSGNTATLSQQIDNNTPMPYGVTAADPAFEKAIRAMALIAEGQTGTAGGLDNNNDRAVEANYLINSALDNSATGTPPFGAEKAGDVNDLSLKLDLQIQTLNGVTTQQTNFQNFLQTAVGQLTNADSTQTIVELLNQQSALQASYQALATVRQLSLLNYLK